MFKEATDLIEGMLYNGWGQTPITFDNVEYNPQRNSAFLRVQIEWVNTAPIAIGGRARGTGYIDLSLFVPQNTGTSQVNGLADDLSVIFNLIQNGALKFGAASTQRVGIQDEWYQLKVLIPFTYDECY